MLLTVLSHQVSGVPRYGVSWNSLGGICAAAPVTPPLPGVGGCEADVATICSPSRALCRTRDSFGHFVSDTDGIVAQYAWNKRIE